MPNQTKERNFKEIVSSIATKELFWRYENESIIVDIPDELIHTNKINVLEPFIREFRKNIVYQSKVQIIKEFLIPFILKINEIHSVFVSFSEEMNKIEIIILLSNRKYDRKLSEKLFDVRLAIEDKYTDYQIDFLEIPIFDRREEDIVPRIFVKIYP